jgi:replicative DNA helicase
LTYYLALLKHFLQDKTNWLKLSRVINKSFLKANHPELATLFNVVEAVYTDSDASSLTVDDLQLHLIRLYPRTTLGLYSALLSQLSSTNVSGYALLDAVKAIRTRECAAELARKALAVSDGLESAEALQTALQEYTTEQAALFGDTSPEEESPFVNDDLQYLIDRKLSDTGLFWRLNSLNRALGPLRRGNFGFAFARPETGKTTFLASELSFMAEQGDDDKPILFFNNEEEGETKLERVYQASLGLTEQELKADIAGNRAKYLEKTKGRFKLIDDAGLTAQRIEQVIKQYPPRLIVFDQIDKIRGFNSDRTDLELASIYRWARELAKAHAPVIAICQAGATGDGKKWLTMNDVDNSKTGKQAEADWILGIGKTYDGGLEGVRYLHLSKNKLSGGPDSDQSLRHGRWEVKIRPEIARYEDFV